MKRAIQISVVWVVFQIVASLIVYTFLPIELKAGFTFKEIGFHSLIPDFLASRANFDGFHYAHIAQFGYGLYEQTFFPLFPFTLGVLGRFVASDIVTSGLILNLILAFASILLFYKLAKATINDEKQSIWTVFFFLSFPSAFFLLALYTESLFLFLLFLYFYLSSSKRVDYAAILIGFFLGTTRLAGSFAGIVPLIFCIVEFINYRKFNASKLIIALSPMTGLLAYMFYLLINFKDPLLFISAQKGFANGRSTQAIITLPQVYFRYFKIITGANIDFAYFISIVEFVIFSTVFAGLLFGLLIIVGKQKQSIKHFVKNKSQNDFLFLGIILFSLLNLILPTTTGTFSSVPRYALTSIAIYLIEAKYLPEKMKVPALIFQTILQIVLLTYFQKGYFVA